MNRRDFLTKPISFMPQGGLAVSKPPAPQALAGLEPYTGTWGYAEAAHLLRRTMFGAKKADVDTMTAKTLSQAVDMLLAPPPGPNPPEPIKYVGTTPTATWVNTPYKTSDHVNLDNGYLAVLQTWYLQQMISQPLSINEKMTLFWHNHFSTGANSVKYSIYIYKQNVLLRTNALGNFKDLVKNITLDPAMLRYLNGNTNTKNGPNENYGRELQELFTIGKGPEIAPGNYTNYTEDDIKAAAKVLTGWAEDYNTVDTTFSASNHNTTDKQFSSNYGNTVIQGRSGLAGAAQELDELITMIFNQPATAQYICRKIYRWFVSTSVTPEVEQNIIVPLADLLKTNNFEIKPVLQKLFNSAHFFDPLIRGGLIKNPMDLGVAMLRTFPVDTMNTDGTYDEPFMPTKPNGQHWALRPFRRTLATMLYDLFNPPNVAGYAAYYQTPQLDELWINADTLQKRVKLADDLVLSHMVFDEGYGYAIINAIAFAKQTSDPSNVTVLLDEWIKMIFAVDLTAEQKQSAHAAFMGNSADNIWTQTWNAYIQDPSNTSKISAADTRLRTLLRYLLGLAEFQLM